MEPIIDLESVASHIFHIIDYNFLWGGEVNETDMKKLFFSLVAALTLVSCSLPSKLINTASYTEIGTAQPVVAVLADLDVSSEKISYFMIPSKTVLQGGEKNVIKTAVREALLANGNADVLVGLNTQIKYDTKQPSTLPSM